MNTQVLAVEADQLQAKGEELIRAIKDGIADHTYIKQLVKSGSAAWVQDEQGWTALHYAAEQGNSDLCELLLRNGAVWNITSNTGHTAGDVAFSLQHATTYTVLLNEGIRHQMLQAILAADESSDSESESEEAPASTASNNAAFLKSKLRFIQASDGQEVCVDSEDNGVMMGWEREIMLETARKLCEDHPWKEELAVVNCGFGLGIIDEALQSYKPKRHVIIEAHPDVLARMRSTGWYDKPGVEIFEGRWQDWLSLMGEEEGVGLFDALYWDTFSEHYRDLHQFFDVLPNLMRDEHSRFSFFHGLGATSRSFYDVYTSVAEMHLEEVGVTVTWTEVPVTNSEVTWKGIVSRYWNVPSAYRLPLGKLMG